MYPSSLTVFSKFFKLRITSFPIRSPQNLSHLEKCLVIAFPLLDEDRSYEPLEMIEFTTILPVVETIEKFGVLFF